MITHLKTLIRYSHDTGFFDHLLLAVKDDGSAAFMGSAADNGNPNLRAIYKKPIKELTGSKLGMGRLDVLAAYLKSPAFSDEDNNPVTLELERRGEDNLPAAILLKAKQGHKGLYRFLHPRVTDAKVRVNKKLTKLSDDDIVFTPSQEFLRDFQSLAGVLKKFNSDFSLNVDNGMLYMELGGDDTFRFPVVEVGNKNIDANYKWPIDKILKVLRMAQDLDRVTIGIVLDAGIIEVTIDDDEVSAEYTFTAT